MSKICPSCGNQQNDDAVFCNNCGTNLNAAAPAPEAAPAPVFNAQPTFAPGTAPAPAKKQLNLTAIIISAVAAVLALVLIITGISALANQHKSAAKKYVKAAISGKYSTMAKMYPDFMKEIYDDDEIDFEEMAEEQCEDITKYFDEEFDGEDYKLKYEITKYKELSEKKIEDTNETLEEYYDVDANITKAYEVKGKIIGVRKSDKREKSIKFELTIYKENGKWKTAGLALDY